MNHDLTTMRRLVQEAQDGTLLAMSDIAMQVPKEGEAAKAGRIKQGKAILRAAANPLMQGNVKFSDKLKAGLRNGKATAIRTAQRFLREAGVPQEGDAELAAQVSRDILSRQERERQTVTRQNK